ncbi:hypothetical protein PGT21_034050 [Puccinia graminis f. sp. tritici]|uniref:Uncharacterized protein n=1 Tax=Puccinia graminis f. sp. tritici TaxID=56615 RepID=A0A5B0MZP1_PUCGR|nr:hypothetical protein PGT21_034050 [Puccinia graminis f. sp. tritici]
MHSYSAKAVNPAPNPDPAIPQSSRTPSSQPDQSLKVSLNRPHNGGAFDCPLSRAASVSLILNDSILDPSCGLTSSPEDLLSISLDHYRSVE